MITGRFGESLVLYWLSKHGFECASVDHTGIDLIARNPVTAELMGISVKSRSRNVGKEETDVTIGRDELDKAQAACNAFGCDPYFAIVVDARDTIRCFMVGMAHLTEPYGRRRRSFSWKMSPRALETYYDDPEVIVFEFQHRTIRWWKEGARARKT
jgi:Holliday junction resolvase-like predicted endonuclease